MVERLLDCNSFFPSIDREGHVRRFLETHLDESNNTPMHLCCERVYQSANRAKIINVLLKYNTNLDLQNKDGDTVLHLAARNMFKNVCKSLIAAQAKRDISNHNGETAQQILNQVEQEQEAKKSAKRKTKRQDSVDLKLNKKRRIEDK